MSADVIEAVCEARWPFTRGPTFESHSRIQHHMSAASLLGSRAALSGASVATSTANARRHSFSAAARFTTRAAISQPPSGGEAEANTERAKVSMVSLGCPKNTVDGEVMLGDLFANGFDVIDEHEDADAIIVNTCGFVEDAKNESVDAILAAAAMKAEQAQDGKKKKIIVTGCLAQRYADDLADEMPEVDVVMGFENYKDLPEHARRAARGGDWGG